MFVDAKLGGMRKAQNFIVCPVSNQDEHLIIIQSDKRIARINMDTKKAMLSDGKGGHQGFAKLNPFCGAKEVDAPQELIDELNKVRGNTNKPVTLVG